MILLRVLVGNLKTFKCCQCRNLSSVAAGAVPSLTTAEKYSKTPGEVYEHKVTNEGLTDDSHQREVIKQFDHLHERLQGYKPPVTRKNMNILSALFFGNSAEEKRSNRIPRGVYVWGTVGGGK